MAKRSAVAAAVNDQEGQYDATPEGSAKRWGEEFKAAKQSLQKWHKTAEECDERYRDEEDREGDRLNLYAAGIDLKEATLYGSTPTVDVTRRYNDQDDDDGRVAGELMDRLLNGDLERDEEQFPRAIGLALKDWLIPGFGLIWERLERETEAVPEKPAITDPQTGTVQAEGVPATTRVTREDVATDYVYWKDILYSPARVFSDWRWAARRTLLSKPSFTKKFGKEQVPLSIGADPKDKTIPKTPWARVELWEIWDKENLCLWWYVDGHPRVLIPLDPATGQPFQSNPNGSLPDPLGLSTFWPFPEPLIEGASNSKYIPRPTYARAQDLYNSVDDETTRIGLLRDAIDASCVYDQTVGELADILNSKGQNKAVPAKNYKALAEKGGIAASVLWKPLEAIVAALTQLRDLRREDIELIYQVDGTSDIMRGQATEGGATATEQAIKAKYGSIRGGKQQKRFAQFCSDAQRIRAEIIAKHFDPQTIAMRANVEGLPPEDQQRVPAAMEIIKSDISCYRIVVKAESVSLTDYAANKQESMDVLQTIGTFAQVIQPIVAAAPQLGPGFMRLLTVFIARVKGGENAEPILDELVKQAESMAEQAAQQQAMAAQNGPPPDPKLQAEQVKAGAAQTKADAEKFKAGASVQQTQMDTQKAVIEHQIDMRKLEAEVRTDALKTVLGTSEPQKAQV